MPAKPKQRLVPVTSWVHPSVRAAYEDIAKTEGLTLSKVTGNHLEEALARRLHIQHAGIIGAVTKQSVEEPLKKMGRTQQKIALQTYYAIEHSRAIEQAGIRAYIPLPNWEDRYEVWSRPHFQYEAEADQYRCPTGTVLKRQGTWARADGRRSYEAPAAVCNACPVKAQCTTSQRGRRVYRYEGEEYLERVRAYHQTEACQKALRKRQVWVEPLFAEAKDWHGLRRFRLRRLWRVNCEARLIAAGQNLKRLLQQRGWGQRPLPSGAAIHPGFSLA